MAADGLGADVGPHHHDRGVPADEGPDPALEVLVAGELRLLVGGDGVDVGGRDGGREVRPASGGPARGSASAGSGPGSGRGRRTTSSKASSHSDVSPGSASGSWWLTPSNSTLPCFHRPGPGEDRLVGPDGPAPSAATGRARVGRCASGMLSPMSPALATAGSGRPWCTPTGRASGTPGPGGWAWAVDGGPSDSGGEAHTTNQRMEVTAVVRALRVPARAAARGQRLDLRRELLPPEVVGRVEAAGLAQHPGKAGGQPGPVAGAARRWPSTRTGRSPSSGSRGTRGTG